MHPQQSPSSNPSSETLASSKPSRDDSSVQPPACGLCSMCTCSNIAQWLRSLSQLSALADCPLYYSHNSLFLENFSSAFKAYFKCPLGKSVISSRLLPQTPPHHTHTHTHTHTQSHAATMVPAKPHCSKFTHVCPPYKMASSLEAGAKSQALVWTPVALSDSILFSFCKIFIYL